jgi:hypothetical protein
MRLETSERVRGAYSAKLKQATTGPPPSTSPEHLPGCKIVLCSLEGLSVDIALRHSRQNLRLLKICDTEPQKLNYTITPVYDGLGASSSSQHRSQDAEILVLHRYLRRREISNTSEEDIVVPKSYKSRVDVFSAPK